jgi:rRNA-processing protein FCF1
MKFLLDTNFLLIPGQFRVDVFAELHKFGRPELFILDLVLKELDKIADGRGQDAGSARLGLALLKKNRVKMLKTHGRNTDSEIERIASEGNYAVCTQDKDLINKLRKEHIQVASLRQKKYLELS